MNNSELSKLIRDIAGQRYDATALKLIRNDDVIPSEAIRPIKDKGYHLALCQAFALSRRDGKTVYMEKEDHWCWAPLIAFGHVELQRESNAFSKISKMIGIEDSSKAEDWVCSMPKLEKESIRGILSAPLSKADFSPDIILINCRASELRVLLLAIKYKTGELLKSGFDAIDSCVWSIISPIQDGNYRITIPDPGDYARALTDENDLILSIPALRIQEFTEGLKHQMQIGTNYNSFHMDMKNDFPRPPFYNELYAEWGLPQGENW